MKTPNNKMPDVKKRQNRNSQLQNSQFNKMPNVKKRPRLITKLQIQQNAQSNKTLDYKTPNETKTPKKQNA